MSTADGLREVLDELSRGAAEISTAVFAAGSPEKGEEGENSSSSRMVGSTIGSDVRRPLIVLHGLQPAFVKTLLDTDPLALDPAFVAAHASRRRYRPRRRLAPSAAGAAAAAGGAEGFAHWVYPELVTGLRRVEPEGRGPVDSLGRPVAAVVSDGLGEGEEGQDLAAVFCRASLWSAGRVDVLLLDGDVWAEPGLSLRKARKRGVELVEEGEDEKTAMERKGWGGLCLEMEEEIPSLGDRLTENVAADAEGCGLMEILEETVYDHWLDLFEVLTPQKQHHTPRNGTSLDWSISQALEANADMARDIALQRKRRRPEAGLLLPVQADWTHLLRRLRLRLALLATAPPKKEKAPRRGRGRASIDLVPVPMPPRSRRRALSPRPAVPIDSPPASPPSSSSEENQRALDRVTYLGGILLPVSLVSSVLSMNEDFEPGQPLFWVFWAAACPLTLLTLLVIYADKLRRAEVWVEVSSSWGGSEAGDEDEDEKRTKKGKGKRESKASTQKFYMDVSEPVLASYSPPPPPPRGRKARPAAVTYSAGGEDVIVDLGPALDVPQRMSSAVSLSSAHDQGQESDPAGPGGEIGAGEEEEEEDEEDTEGDAGSGVDPSLVIPSSATADTRPHAWRREQLGWAGAARCILRMQKPLRVEDGLPPVGRDGPERGGGSSTAAARARVEGRPGTTRRVRRSTARI